MRLVIACAVVLWSSPVFGQTVESVLDLSALGWGATNMPEPVETDGDMSTREWLVQSRETNARRVVAERAEGLCAGPWFTVSAHPFVTVAIRRVGLIHKLFVRDEFTTPGQTRVVALDTPMCR